MLISILLLAGLISGHQDAGDHVQQPAADGFVSLFDGESLDEWEGDEAFWSVENGEIVGRTTSENPAAHNTFLILKGDPVSDFEFRAEVRVIGDNNSGIQYRSKRGDGFRMTGYQCDIHPNPPYNGMLYEEGGRGIIATHGSRVRIDADGAKKDLEQSVEPKIFSLDDWNEYIIIARGNRLEHRIGDHVTVIVEDDEAGKSAQEGIIAFQLHVGAPYEVRFRKVRLKRIR